MVLAAFHICHNPLIARFVQVEFVRAPARGQGLSMDEDFAVRHAMLPQRLAQPAEVSLLFLGQDDRDGERVHDRSAAGYFSVAAATARRASTPTRCAR